MKLDRIPSTEVITQNGLPTTYLQTWWNENARKLETNVYDNWVVTPEDYGATGNGTTDDTTAIQNAINAVAVTGGTIVFKAKTYKHSGLVFKNKVQYQGQGRDTNSSKGTVLIYTGTSDGVQINNPINSSTPANISVEGVTFKNQNVNSGKGCFADTGSTDLKIRWCTFVGSDRGLILDQSELVDINECDFEGVPSQTCLIWLVNGADRTPSAMGGFTNRIAVRGCQLDASSGCVGIVDDGGGVHSFIDNNYNAGLHHIRAAGVGGLIIQGGNFESASSQCVYMHSNTLLGTASGQCTPVLFSNPFFVPTTGQACVICYSAGQLTFLGGFYGNTTSQKVTGTGNISGIFAMDMESGGGGALFDGLATYHFQVDLSGFVTNIMPTLVEEAAASVATPASGRQTLFIDTADHKLKRKDSTGTVTIIN